LASRSCGACLGFTRNENRGGKSRKYNCKHNNKRIFHCGVLNTLPTKSFDYICIYFLEQSIEILTKNTGFTQKSLLLIHSALQFPTDNNLFKTHLSGLQNNYSLLRTAIMYKTKFLNNQNKHIQSGIFKTHFNAAK